MAALGHRDFDVVNVIGVLGADVFGDYLERELSASGAITYISRRSTRPTRLVITLRHGDLKDTHARLMISSRDSPCDELESSAIEPMAPILATSTVLVVDGYSFLAEPRRSAVIHAMRLCRANGGLVAIDVVPHNAYAIYDLAEFRQLTMNAGVVAVELRTMRGFYQMPSSDSDLGDEEARDLSARLSREFPDTHFLLRFGYGEVDRTLSFGPIEDPQIFETGYRHTSHPHGFGDRLLINELAILLSKAREHR